jgi:L-threonine kinase
VYSSGSYLVSPDTRWQVQGAGRKVRAALRVLSRDYPSIQPGRVKVTTRLPSGRGYGASTADVGAALYAANQAYRANLSPEDISRIAVRVEPTDSTIFPGLTLFAHRTGSFHEHLGPALDLVVLVLDPGGEVDTEQYNRLDHSAKLRALASEHRRAFDLLCFAIRHADPETFGAACTLSATLHQQVLFNPLLEAAQRMAGETGAVGICRAHSGTLLGMLYDPLKLDPEGVLRRVSSPFYAEMNAFFTRLTNGGVVVPPNFPVVQSGADIQCLQKL